MEQGASRGVSRSTSRASSGRVDAFQSWSRFPRPETNASFEQLESDKGGFGDVQANKLWFLACTAVTALLSLVASSRFFLGCVNFKRLGVPQGDDKGFGRWWLGLAAHAIARKDLRGVCARC